MDNPTTTEPVLERVALQVARAVAQPGDGVPKRSLSYERKAARAILREVADVLAERSEEILWKQGTCACERESLDAIGASEWLREQAAEEGARDG